MAVQIVRSPHDYQCISSDEKPVAPEGSTMHIVDTGEELVIHEDIWVPDLRWIRRNKPV
jgi:hypothetical protein